uniref:Uncharacterized protein n=1 Tax=mine drainage metagenome TaxID=410659 RepID=E6PJB4_9ZZZZ
MMLPPSWHRQPEGLSIFDEAPTVGYQREYLRVRWGGLWNYRGSPSEAVAVLERNNVSAHVCFVSPAIRNTHPSVEDNGSGVKVLPTLFYREILRPFGITPDAVAWYQMVNHDVTGGRWIFRRSRLVWIPSRKRCFLWWTLREYHRDHFVRETPVTEDEHFSSVPFAVIEAVRRQTDSTLRLIELPESSKARGNDVRWI